MTTKEKNKQFREKMILARAENARKENEAVEAFRSLDIKAGDFIQVSYISKLWGKEELINEVWYADATEHSHYPNLSFLKNLMFWNLSGGYTLCTSVGKYFDIKKVEATQELLERVSDSKNVSAGISEAYNSGGQYKGD